MKPDYFLHVTLDGTEIACRDEPFPSFTRSLSIWRIRDDEGDWEETLTRAREPRGAGWQWLHMEDYVSSRWRRLARKPEDLKWIRKPSGPGRQVPGHANVKPRKQSRPKGPGHA